MNVSHVTRSDLATVLPQFGLRVDLGGDAWLELPTDDQCWHIARAASDPDAILDQGKDHYLLWYEHHRTRTAIKREWMRRFWRARDPFSRPTWRFVLATVLDGEPVGVTSIFSGDVTDDPRVVYTGSWLLKCAAGENLGARARAGALELLFRHMGVREARSSAALLNHASNSVSTAFGYTRTGTTTDRPESGEPRTINHYSIAARDWFNSPRRKDYRLSIRGGGALQELAEEATARWYVNDTL